MERLMEYAADLAGYLPFIVVLAAISGALSLAHWLLLRRGPDIGHERQASRQLVMLVLSGVAMVLVLLVLPVSEETRGQLLGLLGVLLTAIIALSSTTFVSNTMAGLMLRLVKNFRPGEFIRVGDHFGRVTERGLFHTEIQTEARDLTTLPNLYLISNPVTVTRSSGTIVDCNVSIGYDVAHAVVRRRLVEAAERAELTEPFVRVIELGDFSVTYRVAGFLLETKELLRKRSEIRTRVLDCLHEAGIEIASPALETQRQIGPLKRLIPETRVREEEVEDAAGDIIFDKAERAETIAAMRLARDELASQIAGWEQERGATPKEDREQWDRRIAVATQRMVTMDAEILAMEQAED
jgi:small-conductance mechanosensitive channel